MTPGKNSSLMPLGRKSNNVKTSAAGKIRHSWARTRSPPLKAGHQSCTIATFLSRWGDEPHDSLIRDENAPAAGRPVREGSWIPSKEWVVIALTAELFVNAMDPACPSSTKTIGIEAIAREQGA